MPRVVPKGLFFHGDRLDSDADNERQDLAAAILIELTAIDTVDAPEQPTLATVRRVERGLHYVTW